MGSRPIGISGSRVAAVLGLSPYRTQVDVWAEICEQRRPGFAHEHGLALPAPPDSAAIRWGLAFEDEIAQLASHAHAAQIRGHELGLILRCPRGCEITVHVDGIYQDGNDTLHEGKTTTEWTFRERWGEPGSDRLPREYQAQVQTQMVAARANGFTTDTAVVSVLCWPTRPEAWEEAGLTPDTVPRRKWAETLAEMGYFHRYVVRADPQLQALITERCDAFWLTHVVPEVPPPPTSMEDIRLLFPEPKGTVVADDRCLRMAEEYIQINEEWRSLDARKKELATAIVAWANPKAEHPIDGDSVEKLIVRSATGQKLGSYDGKSWRPGRR